MSKDLIEMKFDLIEITEISVNFFFLLIIINSFIRGSKKDLRVKFYARFILVRKRSNRETEFH